MAEAPKPRLALIDRAMEGVEPLSSAATDRKIVSRYAPNIAKLARADERAGILQALGVKQLEDASQLEQLRAERDARPTAGEEAKHGRHQRWMGIAIGIPIGAILACVAIFMMQGVIWDTATRAFREQAMTGAIISSQDREQQREGPTFRDAP